MMPIMRRIVDFSPVLASVLRTFVDRVTITNEPRALEDLLEEHPRALFVLNHGPAHMPIVPVAALGRALVEHGGGSRRCIGITFRGLYLVPGIRELARYLTQVEEPPSVDELIERSTREDFDDVLIMPEGHNCVFGDPGSIQPFTSPRFVELALRMGAPIVLAVHSGLEETAIEVAAPEEWLKSPLLSMLPYGIGDSLARMGTIALPTSAHLPELRMRFAVHELSIGLDAYAALSPHAKRDWVAAEAARVRRTMIVMHAELRGLPPPADVSEDAEPSQESGDDTIAPP